MSFPSATKTMGKTQEMPVSTSFNSGKVIFHQISTLTNNRIIMVIIKGIHVLETPHIDFQHTMF